MATVLVTGSAGFIGSYMAKRLLARGDEVIGLDNINDYYDVGLKYGRLAETGIKTDAITYGRYVRSETEIGYRFIKLDLEDRENIAKVFVQDSFDVVVHLAAQAGVRYSLENPHAYINSNVVGFLNILEGCRHHDVKHTVFASSSSVYGLNTKYPFSTHDNVDHPVSLYAATKKANELMAHSYSHLYQLPITGLRFFTVYGPCGRPDMALFLFTRAILAGEPIDVYNYGNMKRDFTYIDDIIEGVVRVIDRPVTPNPAWNGHQPDAATSVNPYRLYNIGNSKPVELNAFIEAIEKALRKTAKRNLLPLQPGDVPETDADVTDLVEDFNYKPETPVQVGIDRFIAWYKQYYKVK